MSVARVLSSLPSGTELHSIHLEVHGNARRWVCSNGKNRTSTRSGNPRTSSLHGTAARLYARGLAERAAGSSQGECDPASLAFKVSGRPFLGVVFRYTRFDGSDCRRSHEKPASVAIEGDGCIAPCLIPISFPTYSKAATKQSNLGKKPILQRMFPYEPTGMT